MRIVWISLLVGCGLGCTSPPAPVEVEPASIAPLASLSAGVATREFTPDPALGYPIGGHGLGPRRQEWPFLFGAGWPGRLALDAHQALHAEGTPRSDLIAPATGTRDPLSARALVLQAGDGPPLALVRFDAVVGSQRLSARVVELVSDLGFRPEGVIVAATHTHSGVGGYLRGRFAQLAALDAYRAELAERLAQACAGAIRDAYADRRPAAIGWGQAWDRGRDGAPRVAQNRRAEDFPSEIAPDDVDPEIGLLKVYDLEAGQILAALVNFAVHPDVLGQENLHFSADLAGAIEREVSRRLAGGPPVLFFNGAEGDVNPRGLQRGGSAEWPVVERLAGAFADAAAPALAALPTPHRRVELRAQRAWQEFGEPFLFVATDRRAFLAADACPYQRALAAPLALPFNLLLWILGVDNGRLAFNWNFSAGFRFGLAGYSEHTRFPFHALAISAGPGQSAVLATVPGEAIHSLGEALKLSARRLGAEQAFVLGLANGAMMYVTDEAEYYRGGYEAMVTLFGPRTGERVVRAAERCLEGVSERGPPPRASVRER